MPAADRHTRARRRDGGLVRGRARDAAIVAAVGAAAAVSVGSRPGAGPTTRPETYALITHPAVPVRDLPLGAARRIFLGEQDTWPDGTRIVLLVQTGGPARATLLRRLYQMDDAAFKRYWIARTFRGGSAAGPKLVSSDALAQRLTATVPGAVALVPAADTDRTVKVLRVDGRLPGEAGYPLAVAP